MSAHHDPVRDVLNAWLDFCQGRAELIPDGNYVNGAMTALAAYSSLEEQYERLQHIADCADTPLMRDVLAERDGLKEQLEALRGEVRRAQASIALGFYAGSRSKTAEILRGALNPAREPVSKQFGGIAATQSQSGRDTEWDVDASTPASEPKEAL